MRVRVRGTPVQANVYYLTPDNRGSWTPGVATIEIDTMPPLTANSSPGFAEQDEIKRLLSHLPEDAVVQSLTKGDKETNVKQLRV